MSALTPSPRPRSAAVPLACAFAALIAYASLYPFSGWRWPPGLTVKELSALPWPPYRPQFDIYANLIGYLPMGALAYAAAARNGWRLLPSLLVGLVVPAALSFALEVAQNFVPGRVPSRLDLALNAAGGAVGAVVGALLQASGLADRWQSLRDRWFLDASAGARVLLLLWPLGLLFPAPVPLGLGQVMEPIQAAVEAAVEDTPWSADVAGWMAHDPAAAPALAPVEEWLAITLGLLAPCLLAHSATRPGVRRIALAAGATGIAWVATTLSAALNFGPTHATAWMTPNVLPALASGFVLAAALAWIGRRMARALALVVLTALVVLVAKAPADPYFADSLQAWQQGRFIRFHGLAQWVGWLWPYAAMAWLLTRIGARREG